MKYLRIIFIIIIIWVICSLFYFIFVADKVIGNFVKQRISDTTITYHNGKLDTVIIIRK